MFLLKERYNVIVYTKNETQPETETNMCHNMGAEASVYLKHIVQNYDYFNLNHFKMHLILSNPDL